MTWVCNTTASASPTKGASEVLVEETVPVDWNILIFISYTFINVFHIYLFHIYVHVWTIDGDIDHNNCLSLISRGSKGALEVLIEETVDIHCQFIIIYCQLHLLIFIFHIYWYLYLIIENHIYQTIKVDHDRWQQYLLKKKTKNFSFTSLK